MQEPPRLAACQVRAQHKRRRHRAPFGEGEREIERLGLLGRRAALLQREIERQRCFQCLRGDGRGRARRGGGALHHGGEVVGVTGEQPIGVLVVALGVGTPEGAPLPD